MSTSSRREREREIYIYICGRGRGSGVRGANVGPPIRQRRQIDPLYQRHVHSIRVVPVVGQGGGWMDGTAPMVESTVECETVSAVVSKLRGARALDRMVCCLSQLEGEISTYNRPRAACKRASLIKVREKATKTLAQQMGARSHSALPTACPPVQTVRLACPAR